ncbi:MAG: hypothetical protein WD267_07060 [Balneolales bacterium]
MQTRNKFEPAILVLLLTLTACSGSGNQDVEYYTAEDYDKVPKFNSHVHLYEENNTWIDQAVQDQFKVLSFISSSPGRTETMSVYDQEHFIQDLIQLYPDQIYYKKAAYHFSAIGRF